MAGIEEKALILELFDRGIEIERIAKLLKMSTMTVKLVVLAYRKLTKGE